MRTDVLGVGFDSITLEQAADRAEAWLEGGKTGYVVTPNPEIVMLCRESPAMQAAVTGADFVLPDGIGIIYGAKILGRPLPEKVPGVDFITALFARMAKKGQSVYLLGAKPGVVEQAAANLQARYPGLVIAGTGDGYFQEEAPVIAKINEASPDLLLVCLGAPKQELFMANNKERLQVRLMAGLGGSLDVFAGIVERAPESWQKLGLEWLYRLKQEPSRWKRMLKLPRFLFAAVGQRLRGK